MKIDEFYDAVKELNFFPLGTTDILFFNDKMTLVDYTASKPVETKVSSYEELLGTVVHGKTVRDIVTSPDYEMLIDIE